MTGMKLRVLLNRTMCSLTLATAVALVASAPVSAQSPAGAAGFAEMSVHDYLHRDIILFADALELDEGQRVIVESLYEDYRSTFDTGWARTQQRFTDMRDDLKNVDREQVMSMVLAPFERWEQERDEIRRTFEENVKVILNRRQLENWPAFQRQMVREKSLHRGRLSGESLNLFHVLRDLRLDDRTLMDIDNVMEQYDLALHDALQQRNEALAESQRAMLNSIRTQEPSLDTSRLQSEIRRRVALRDVNDQFIDYIADALPPDRGEEFRANALERAYPRAFRPVPAVRVLREAERMDDIDSATRDEIVAIREAMLDELDGIAVRLYQSIRDHEPKAKMNRAKITAARQTGEEVERLVDPSVRIYRERDERVNEYMTQVRDLLGEEKFAGLPGSSRWLPQRRVHQVDGPPSGTTRRQVRDAQNDASGSSNPTGVSGSQDRRDRRNRNR